MSTYRYSMGVRVRITYIDFDAGNRYNMDGNIRFPNGSYRCFLRCGVHTATIIVGAPAFLSQAVDSPEAFDAAAIAAINFASNDHDIEGQYTRWDKECQYKDDLSGIAIFRGGKNT